MLSVIRDFFSSSMTVVSFKFMMFVLVTAGIYYCIPKRFRWIVLTVASTVFYLCGGLETILLVILSTLVAYFFSLLMTFNHSEQKKLLKQVEKTQKKKVKEVFQKKRRLFLFIEITFVLVLLIVIKYTGFFLGNINRVLGVTGLSQLNTKNILSHIPAVLGCSYYTLSLVSYMTDVYRNKYPAERNFFRLFLFVSYFPHIIQGPIERYDALAPQFEEPVFDFDRAKKGAMLIIWGFFKKLVIADRLNAVSGKIFSEYDSFGGFTIFFGTVVFSIQLYADWTAYCDIVGGVSEIFGITLTKNFARPYFSQTMPEFWRRWHMSMGSFFKDYVLYPVSASKFSLSLSKKARGRFGNSAGKIIASFIPILSVWVMTGFWHGAGWCFILWGAYQGILILLSVSFEEPMKKLNERLNFKTDTFSWRLFRTLRTFALCCFGRIFFKASSVGQAFSMFKGLFRISMPVALNKLGIDDKEWVVVFIALLIMLIYSLIEEKYESVEDALDKQPVILKWAVLIGMIMFILIFGVYGSSAGYTAFVYEQF